MKSNYYIEEVPKEIKPYERGAKGIDREFFYRFLYENSDIRGIVVYSQRQIASLLGIGHDTVSEIYNDFIDMNYLKRISVRQFEVVYDPDELEWGEEFHRISSELRKRKQTYYRNKKRKQEQINEENTSGTF